MLGTSSGQLKGDGCVAEEGEVPGQARHCLAVGRAQEGQAWASGVGGCYLNTGKQAADGPHAALKGLKNRVLCPDALAVGL